MTNDKNQLPNDAARPAEQSSDAKKRKAPSRRKRRRGLRAATATEANYLLSLRTR